jgi:hypothetical protein
MKPRRPKRHPVTVLATGDQLYRWEDWGRVYKRDVPAFLSFAGDWLARYLRELNRERSRPDPVLFRREEKRLLEELVRTAKDSARYLPQKPFTTPHFCQRKDPAGDLKRAVQAVEAFWERNGEALGI